MTSAAVVLKHSQLKPPLLLQKSTSVVKHPLNEMDDNYLLEDIRDILSDRNNAKTDSSHKFLYSHYEVMDNKRLQLRIDSILLELEKQENNVYNEPPSKKGAKASTGSPEEHTLTKANTYNEDAFLYDDLTPKDWKEKQEKLRTSREYTEIKHFYIEQMSKLLEIPLENKKLTKEDLFIQASMPCKERTTGDCPCTNRIDLTLNVYHLLMKYPKLWGQVPIAPLLTIDKRYAHQQMYNDFLHIKLYHVESNEYIEVSLPEEEKEASSEPNIEPNEEKQTNIEPNTQSPHVNTANIEPNAQSPQGNEEKQANVEVNTQTNVESKKGKMDEKKVKTDDEMINIDITKNLCKQFEEKYPCKKLDKCLAFVRHYRDRSNKKNERDMFYIEADAEISRHQRQQRTNKDWVFQEECDKIHCFFLHSTIQFSEHDPNDVKQANQRINEMNYHGFGRSWSQQVPRPESPQNKEKTTKSYVGAREDENWMKTFKGDDKDPNEGYKLLIEHMGIFRWQSAHGFRTGQNRGLMHLKPRFKNFKREALENSFHAATKDNWNQTFRKSKIFCASFASQRVRTLSAGRFHDEVSDQKSYWKEREKITLEEVITLKLYTDFDKLQRELKKCFRWETTLSVINKYDDAQRDEQDEKRDEEARNELENRLCEFFHWRINLLTMLTKFGIHINEKNLVLYHGINAKMILNPAETLAFYGPLSTTSSYHVAKTFATAKGMVLKITSNFPRLRFCTAFDASLISDYPEESEYLISFMYLRVLEVRTRPIVSDVNNREQWRRAPLASKTRVIFFSIHLFKEQMFSMSSHLEYYLKEFLKCQSLQCCENNYAFDQTLDPKIKKESFLSWLCCEVAHHPKAITTQEDWKKNERTTDEKHKYIMTILWTKFNLFRIIPNMKQVVKFDEISDGLKEFFLDKLDDKSVHGKSKWAVSFKKVLRVFPNAKEIHFINSYRFDDELLDKLLVIIRAQQNEEKERERAKEDAKKKAAKSQSDLKQNDQPKSENASNEINELTAEDAQFINELTAPPLPGLEKVVFLYYNYEDVIDENGTRLEHPETSDMFFNPNELNTDKIAQLHKLNWCIKFGKNDNRGYKIRLYHKKHEISQNGNEL